MNLPQSTLIKRQARTFRADYTNRGRPETLVAKVRWDDECGNGHNTFAVTATIYGPDCYRGEPTTQHKHNGRTLWAFAGGCCHDEIAKRIPRLAPFIKWHLINPDGPHAESVVYLAGERDHWGLLKGEFRQHTSRGQYQAGGREGVPHWKLELVGVPEERETYADTAPAAPAVIARWVPAGLTGEGKARELAAARHCAVWPDATDAQLSVPADELRAALAARLPALMAEFRQAVESLGFTY